MLVGLFNKTKNLFTGNAHHLNITTAHCEF